MKIIFEFDPSELACLMLEIEDFLETLSARDFARNQRETLQKEEEDEQA